MPQGNLSSLGLSPHIQIRNTFYFAFIEQKFNFDLEENLPISRFALFAGHTVYQITSLTMTTH